MQQQARTGSAAARLEREVVRERQQHTTNYESKAGINCDESDRYKDARENSESARMRR